MVQEFSSWRDLLREIYPKFIASEIATVHGPSIRRWFGSSTHKPQAGVLGKVVAATQEPYREQLIQLLEKDHVLYTLPPQPSPSSWPREAWNTPPVRGEIPIPFLRAYYRSWKSSIFGPFKEMALLELLGEQIKHLLGQECQCILARCFWVDDKVPLLRGEVLGETGTSSSIFPHRRHHGHLFFGVGSLIAQCIINDDILLLHDTDIAYAGAGKSVIAKSAIVSPLLFEDKVIGALQITHATPNFFLQSSWSDEDLQAIVEDYCVCFLQVLMLHSRPAERHQLQLRKLSDRFSESVLQWKKTYLYDEEAIKKALQEEPNG